MPVWRSPSFICIWVQLELMQVVEAAGSSRDLMQVDEPHPLSQECLDISGCVFALCAVSLLCVTFAISTQCHGSASLFETSHHCTATVTRLLRSITCPCTCVCALCKIVLFLSLYINIYMTCMLTLSHMLRNWMDAKLLTR